MFKKLILGILLLASYSTAHAQSYNLNCLAGGNMGVAYNGSANKVTVFFQPAPEGTRYRQLARGQCSWVDRAFRVGEPKKICQFGVRDVVVKVNARSHKFTSRTAPYVHKIKDGGYFSLKVRNVNGCMRVTRVNSFERARSISGR